MKKIILTILLFVVVAGVSGGGVYLWQKSNSNSVKKDLQNQVDGSVCSTNQQDQKTCPACLTNQIGQEGYKKIDLTQLGMGSANFISEVPISWNVSYSNVEIGSTNHLPTKPALSINKDFLTPDGSDITQADIYFVRGDAKDELIKKVGVSELSYLGITPSVAVPRVSGISWSKENVGGITADVATDAANGYAGNKQYYLTSPDNSETIMIFKQSGGINPEFDNGFQHFIDSIKFTK